MSLCEYTAITYERLTEKIKEGRQVVIVGADWCNLARNILRYHQREKWTSFISRENIQVTYVDAEISEDTRIGLKCTGIPHVVWFNDGKKLGEKTRFFRNNDLIPELMKSYSR